MDKKPVQTAAHGDSWASRRSSQVRIHEAHSAGVWTQAGKAVRRVGKAASTSSSGRTARLPRVIACSLTRRSGRRGAARGAGSNRPCAEFFVSHPLPTLDDESGMPQSPRLCEEQMQ